MSKKVIIIIAVALTAAVLFAACERSASNPVLATPTSGNTPNATPEATSLSLVQTWGTSTAVYLQTAEAMGLITPVPTSETPQPNNTPEGANTTPGVPPTGVPTETPVPGTTPVVVVPTATPGRPATYTLHSGEFPYCLARRFDVNPTDLLNLNGLMDGQIVQPGLLLQIPQTGSYGGIRARNAHPAQYTVNVDDSFYSIACYYGDVDPTAIAAANGLALTSPLTTGKVLNIP
jgi:LysM repeat protein